MPETIVVVGAGTGGCLTANLLAKELRRELDAGDIELYVVEERGEHAFQPGNLDVAFRGKDPEAFLRPAAPLLDKRIRFRPEGAERIDLQKRCLTLGDAGVITFDHLVIATGAVARPDLMPGLTEGSLSFHLGPRKAKDIWDALQDFQGGKVVVAIAQVPYKCPPSPNEACFLLDEHFRKRGMRDKVEIKLLTPFPRAYPAEAVSEQVQERFDEKGITLEPFFMMDSVDPKKKVAVSMEGTEVPYDLLIAIPPHSGAPLIQRSGIGDAEGFVPTDRETMRVKGQEHVYALGDCTDLPISKSGVVAHLQSLVVANNILADLGKEEGEFAYNGRINCPMEVGDHRLLWVQSTYKEAPQPNRPSMVKYAMKKAFNRMYWKALSGDLEWMFKLYFGPTSEHRLPEVPEAPENEPADVPDRPA